jgi:hypothetical protein
MAKVGLAQIGPAQVDPAQVGLAQVGSTAIWGASLRQSLSKEEKAGRLFSVVLSTSEIKGAEKPQSINHRGHQCGDDQESRYGEIPLFVTWPFPDAPPAEAGVDDSAVRSCPVLFAPYFCIIVLVAQIFYLSAKKLKPNGNCLMRLQSSSPR